MPAAFIIRVRLTAVAAELLWQRVRAGRLCLCGGGNSNCDSNRPAPVARLTLSAATVTQRIFPALSDNGPE